MKRFKINLSKYNIRFPAQDPDLSLVALGKRLKTKNSEVFIVSDDFKLNQNIETLNYEMKCLGPASYHMRIGREVLTWREGKQIDFILGERENQNDNVRTKVRLLPNSLTFLTTIEEFQLPKDIIARFNLKSKWIHQGLLLGTFRLSCWQLHRHL